ncbi:hypothetical protein M501DRAFT_987257 [Patellaria atrata CBS 101060]|uniref:Uncharacterized protein n=1 Tax=Patellaria atrata CBS 101060 TaxID=1346257 RepID=A0A9P4S5J6_9PEZI|nr:hypothetical protein M501DRAFT_987257 [Patellaria atrata CBS 101060]
MREDIVRLNQEAAVRNPRRIPLPVYQRALRDLEEMNRNIELEEAHALRDQTEARPPTEAATRLQEINRRVNRLFNYSTRNPTLERRGEASGEPERLLNENRLPDQRSIPERSTNPFLRARQWLMRDVARTTGPHEQFPINRRSHEGNLPSTPRFPQLNPPQLIPTAPEFERPGQRGGQIYNELTPEYRRNFERQVTGGRRLELAMERERDRSRQLGEQGEASTRRTAPLGPTAPQGPPNSRRSTSSRVPTNPSNVSTVPAWVYTNPPGVNHEWNIHPNSTTAPERSRRVPTPGPAVEQNRDHNGCNHIWEELPEAVGLIMTCERVDCNARQFAQCLRCRERVCAWCNLRRHLLPTTAEQRAARRAECQIQVESDRELLRRREHDLERMRGSVRTLQMEQGEPEDDVE